MITPDPLINRFNIGLRLLERYSGLQTRDDCQVVRASISQIALAESSRYPEADILPQQLKARRRHADDGEFLVIQQNLFANDIGIAIEAPMPKAMTDQDHLTRLRAAFLFEKGSPQSRFAPQKREKVCGHHLSVDLFRLAVSGEVHTGPGERGHVFKDSVLRFQV